MYVFFLTPYIPWKIRMEMSGKNIPHSCLLFFLQECSPKPKDLVYGFWSKGPFSKSKFMDYEKVNS